MDDWGYHHFRTPNNKYDQMLVDKLVPSGKLDCSSHPELPKERILQTFKQIRLVIRMKKQAMLGSSLISCEDNNYNEMKHDETTIQLFFVPLLTLIKPFNH